MEWEEIGDKERENFNEITWVTVVLVIMSTITLITGQITGIYALRIAGTVFTACFVIVMAVLSSHWLKHEY